MTLEVCGTSNWHKFEDPLRNSRRRRNEQNLGNSLRFVKRVKSTLRSLSKDATGTVLEIAWGRRAVSATSFGDPNKKAVESMAALYRLLVMANPNVHSDRSCQLKTRLGSFCILSRRSGEPAS